MLTLESPLLGASVILWDYSDDCGFYIDFFYNFPRIFNASRQKYPVENLLSYSINQSYQLVDQQGNSPNHSLSVSTSRRLVKSTGN